MPQCVRCSGGCSISESITAASVRTEVEAAGVVPAEAPPLAHPASDASTATASRRALTPRCTTTSEVQPVVHLDDEHVVGRRIEHAFEIAAGVETAVIYRAGTALLPHEEERRARPPLPAQYGVAAQ